jgi:hypothetical protein
MLTIFCLSNKIYFVNFACQPYILMHACYIGLLYFSVRSYSPEGGGVLSHG